MPVKKSELLKKLVTAADKPPSKAILTKIPGWGGGPSSNAFWIKAEDLPADFPYNYYKKYDAKIPKKGFLVLDYKKSTPVTGDRGPFVTIYFEWAPNKWRGSSLDPDFAKQEGETAIFKKLLAIYNDMKVKFGKNKLSDEPYKLDPSVPKKIPKDILDAVGDAIINAKIFDDLAFGQVVYIDPTDEVVKQMQSEYAKLVEHLPDLATEYLDHLRKTLKKYLDYQKKD